MAQSESAPRATGRIERARQVEARKLARRSFLRVSAFASLTLFVGAMSAAFLGFFDKDREIGVFSLKDAAAALKEVKDCSMRLHDIER